MSPIAYYFDFCRAPRVAPTSGPPFWKNKNKMATTLAQSCMIPLFRYLLGRRIRFWLYFDDLAARSPTFWGKSSFFGKRYIHSIISFCIDFQHLWVKFCIVATILGHTVWIFAGRKEWFPLAGRHFGRKPTRWPHLAQLCMIPLFSYFFGRGIRFWLYFYYLA